PGLRPLLRLRALPVRVCRAQVARVAHVRPRSPSRRGRLRAALADSRCRAGARRTCDRRHRLGRTPHVRDHLVARGSLTDARTTRASLRFLTHTPISIAARTAPMNEQACAITYDQSHLLFELL